MKFNGSCMMFSIALLCSFNMLRAQDTSSSTTKDTSPHTVQMISVAEDVKVEVLDWGGTGRPLVLLAGKGDTAHVFDQFAPGLTKSYRVYGITRRGYGASSVPPATDENYSADRLGDDILAVLGQIKLIRPVLVGHSVAGEELSSIGTRAPQMVAGLVYLDAAYAYSFYDTAAGDLTVDYDTLRKQLEQFTALAPMKERKQLLADLAQNLPRFEKDIGSFRERLAAAPDNTPAPPDTMATRVDIAIFRGQQKFGGVKCPVLAMYADPHSFGDQFEGHPEALEAAQEKDRIETSAQAAAFAKGNPQAVVIKVPNADHFIFRSNEVEVRNALDTFINALPQH